MSHWFPVVSIVLLKYLAVSQWFAMVFNSFHGLAVVFYLRIADHCQTITKPLNTIAKPSKPLKTIAKPLKHLKTIANHWKTVKNLSQTIKTIGNP